MSASMCLHFTIPSGLIAAFRLTNSYCPKSFTSPWCFSNTCNNTEGSRYGLAKCLAPPFGMASFFAKDAVPRKLPFLQRLPSRNQPFSQRLLFQGNHFFCKGCFSKEITFFAKDAFPRKSPFLQRFPSPLFSEVVPLDFSTTKPNSCRRKLSKSILTWCFLTWWYPQIINFNRVFLNKPSILGRFMETSKSI